MRILIDINHPAYFHFFRNIIVELKKRGHIVKITAKNKECTLDLIKHFGYDYELTTTPKKNILFKGLDMFISDYKLYKIAKKFKPDILVGSSGIRVAHAGKFLGIPSIAMDDTEHDKLMIKLMMPFITAVCTPKCYLLNLGKKQHRFNAYKETAYLHPNYFKPNPKVLKKAGLKKNERFFVLRFVSLGATHDAQEAGIRNKLEFVQRLEKHGKVLITSEQPLKKEFEKYKINLPSWELHSLLSYATLYIGESSTIASECALIGTPAIFISESTRGYIDEQEKYSLVFRYHGKNSEEKAMKKALELLSKKNLKKEYQKKSRKMINSQVDVVKWFVEFIAIRRILRKRFFQRLT